MAEKLSIRKRMDAFKVYIPFIREHGINEELLQQMISEHKTIQEDIRKLQERYETSEEGVPILKRTAIPISHLENDRMRRIDEIINNKLNNAFDCDVVDTKIGYFLGNPINYVVDATNLNQLAEIIEDMRTRENIPDKDTTLGTRTSIAGYGARLVYWSVENNKPILKIANIDPAECIFLYDDSMSSPSYAIQYYPTVEIQADGTKKQVTVVEFHDEVDTYFFKNNGDGFELSDIQPHNLDSCPLFGVENNESLQGEATKILNLIDAYDRTMSDANSEIEATRLAILILRNIGMDEEDIQNLNKTGALEMWGENSDIRYLTKDVNDTMIENHLNRLEKNIHKFAKSVDFSDEAFGGNISGIAIKFKTMSLEQKAIIAEHKFRSALQYQFKLLCAGWAKLGICKPEDYLNIWFGFKRNLPSNIKEEAEATAMLQGRVSERTRLSLLSFIDDVDAELEEMKKDEIEFGNKLEDIEPIGGSDDNQDFEDEDELKSDE